MFSRMQLLASDTELLQRFEINTACLQPFIPKSEISGFEHALQPVLLRNGDNLICEQYRWGLVPPDWRKVASAIWNHTISAKLEYICKRYAWQKVAQSRCLVPATAYFEYHWNDLKGSSKTKYSIESAEDCIFGLAGLYSHWIDPNGNELKTFAICTTQANEVMEFIHNKDAAKNYHRMPVMLNVKDEMDWLDTSIPFMEFAYPNYKPNLVAYPMINNDNIQTTLF